MKHRLDSSREDIISAYAHWFSQANQEEFADHLKRFVKNARARAHDNQVENQVLTVLKSRTQPNLSKGRTAAIKDGYLRLVLDRGKIEADFPGLLDTLEQVLFVDSDFTHRIRASESIVLRDVRVMPDGMHFPSFCAGQLANLFDGVVLGCDAPTCIGVMWGQTVASAIHEITNLVPKRTKQRCDDQADASNGRAHSSNPSRACFPPECVPVSGEPSYVLSAEQQTHWTPADYSASKLALRLACWFHRVSEHAVHNVRVPMLLGVGAYVGLGIKAAAASRQTKLTLELERNAVLKHLEKHPGWSAIFGPNGHASRMDMLITSVGRIDSDAPGGLGRFVQERALQEGLTLKELASLCCGDIAGSLLVDTTRLTPKDRANVKEMDNGWTGLKIAQLRTIARQERMPGVVALCEGADKAEVTHMAIKQGLITRLFCDRPLRDALAARLSS